jgi:hypothetical protein
MAVGAMKEGASDFFAKPVDGTLLLCSVERALEQNIANRREATEHASLLKPRILSAAINEDDGTAALAMQVAGYFGLDSAGAGAIVAQVGKAVLKWRDEAARQGLTKTDIDRKASAFEHRDLEAARSQ